MADPPDGLLGRLFPGNDPAALYQGALTDPATQAQMAQRGLLAMAGSFADSAMPTRMPTPLGAVLGHAAAALGPAQDAVMAARLQAAQQQQASATAAWTMQDLELGKQLPGILARAYGQDTGGPTTPTVPGTIGTPAVATVPHDAGPDWMPGFTIPPNSPTATPDPKLSGSDNLNNLAQTASRIALPPGYTVQRTSGDRPGAEVAGGGGQSQHAKDNAADFQIYRPDGKPIDNTGPDSSGLYGKLALTMRSIASPDIKPWLAWGGNFTTRADGGPRDLMHFDFAGDRGRFGTLAQMEQQWRNANAAPGGGAPKPVQVASTGSMTGLLGPGAGPSGAAPPVPSGGPPGLLTQGPVPPGAVAAGATVRGSWYGNSPGWTDPSDRGNQANGAPVSAGPGIALNIAKDSPEFGKWYDVTFPNGKTLRLQQTDVGPDAKGRGVDVNSVAAGQAGYTPGTFPTDAPITVQPAAGPPGGGPITVAQAGPPTPLVTPPGPGPAVPPITQPQAAPSAAAPGAIPGTPSPQQIAAAKQAVAILTQMRRPVPPDLAEIAMWDIKTAQAIRDAQIKLQSTPFRPSGVLLRGYDANGNPIWTQAPAAPGIGTVYNPQTERPEIAGVTPQAGGPPIVSPTGMPSAPSEKEKATGQTLGQYPTAGVPGEPIGAPGTLNAPGFADPTKPIPSPSNAGRSYQTVIPPISQQAHTPDLHTYGQSQPDWQKTSAEIADAGTRAQTAETNLNYIAKAYQMVESGTWATEKNEFNGVLKFLGIPPPDNAAGLAALQVALHNNYRDTLQTLKAVNSRFTGNEFKINSEAGVSAGNQPEANFSLLTQDLGQLRQLQAFAADWNHAQTIVGSDGSHWVNPNSFRTAWFNQSQNKLQPMIDQAQKDTGPFRGMTGWVPPGFPSGTKPITSGGRPAYQLPNGRIVFPPNG